MMRELAEKRAKLEVIKDKKVELLNLRKSSEIIYGSSVSMNLLKIEIDHVLMYANEFIWQTTT